MSLKAKKLPNTFEERRALALARLSQNLQDARALAPKIVELSDHFIHHVGVATPWKNAGTWPSYLKYFLPLNLARVLTVFGEVERFLPAESIGEIWDFGSGPGTVHWALEEQAWLKPVPLYCLESAKEAVQAHRDLIALLPTHWQPTWNGYLKPGPQSLAVFSYSFLEMRGDLPDLKDFSHILIVEPSTRECGRELMSWRAKLMGQGFTPLAPCTHGHSCPLLTRSTRDWCHLRIGFEGPADWAELESFLPMKNRTLTYSYLLMSRTVTEPPYRGAVRVLGDTLEERGKSRQLICRSDKREFLSWLHKEQTPPVIPSGSLIPDLGETVEKSDEIRPKNPIHWID